MMVIIYAEIRRHKALLTLGLDLKDLISKYRNKFCVMVYNNLVWFDYALIILVCLKQPSSI